MRARQLDLTGGGNAELVAHLIGSFYGSQHVANTDQCSFGLWALGLLHPNFHPLGRDSAVLGGKFDSLPGHVDVVDLLFQHIVGQWRTAPPSACPGVQQVPGVRIRQQCRTPRAPRSDRPGCRTLAWSTTSSWAKRRVARSGKMETLAMYTQDTPLIQTLEIAPRKKGDVMITSPFITIDYTTASDRPQSLAQQRVVVSGRKSNERIGCSTTSAVLETD